MDLQTTLKRKGQAKYRLQSPKTAAGHPVTCTRCCSSGQHLGGPSRFFWSGNLPFPSPPTSHSPKQWRWQLDQILWGNPPSYFLFRHEFHVGKYRKYRDFDLAARSITLPVGCSPAWSFPLPTSPCPRDPVSGVKRERNLQILSNLRWFCWNCSKGTSLIQMDLKRICRCFASVRTKPLLWILTSDLECSSYFCRSLICELNFR